jgi:hypothetical protein
MDEVTEANEGNPSKRAALLAFLDQRNETMGIQALYERAALEAGNTQQELDEALLDCILGGPLP